MSQRRLRLFFALWPDAVTRDALASTAREFRSVCGGRSPPADNIHLTLAFLGSIAERRLPELCALASTIIATPFALDIIDVGCWRAQRLVWAAPADYPPALTALHVALAEALRRRDFPVERRAFKPHVTLLRDAVMPQAPARQLMRPLRWQVGEFVLACSESTTAGVRYRKLGRWPLRAAAE